MSYEIGDKPVAIDLSKLIDVSLTFGPLQLTMQGIIDRLNNLEDENAKKTKQIGALEDENAKNSGRIDTLEDEDANKTRQIEALNAALDELRRQQKEAAAEARNAKRESRESKTDNGEAGGGEGCGDADEHAAIWSQIDHLNDLLGEITERSKTRHTIDELYAARKRHDVDSNPAASRPSTAVSVPSPHFAEDGELADGTLTATETQPPTALGDHVLSKAHERLQGFDETVRYTGPAAAERPSSAPDGSGGDEASNSCVGGGDVSQPQPRSAPGSAQESVRGGSARAPPFSTYDQHRVSRVGPRSNRSSTCLEGGGEGPAVAWTMSPSRHVSQQLLQGLTVSDRLKKDGDDIAYLNRVVAEVLAEMKGLTDNVDQLQTATVVGDETAFRLSDLERRLDKLKRATKAAARLDEEDVDAVKSLPALHDRVRALEDTVAAANKASEMLADKLQAVANAGGGDGGPIDGVGALQFGLLQGTVAGLERQLADLLAAAAAAGDGGGGRKYDDDIAKLQEALRRLREETAALESAVDAATRECGRLEVAKADRTAVDALQERLAGGAGSSASDAAATASRLDDLQGLLDGVMAAVEQLDSDKADKAALRRAQEDLASLETTAGQNAQLEAAAGGGGSPAVTESLLRDLQQQLLSQAEAGGSERESARDDLEAMRELIDQLDRRKADGALVANKAERDYVENALERLMREVEQVLNATNAGLIDTLDKALNILRDMLDGKASKGDINRLRQQMATEGGGAAADGLTGFKGYRCLGCNRAMDTLRPRSTAAKLDPFLNRNPQNHPQDNVTRTIEQQQQLYLGTNGGEAPPPQ